MKRLLLMAAIAGFALAGECVRIEGDRIRAQDLADVPGLEKLPPEADLGYAPLPGAIRVFSRADIHRIAVRYRIEIGLDTFCLERATLPLEPRQVESSMRAALSGTQADIEVVETSKYPVPKGDVVFTAADLRRPPVGRPNEPVLWKGHVLYDGSRRFAIWARVRVKASVAVAVAVDDVPAGQAIQQEHVRVEHRVRHPFGPEVAISDEQVIGAVSRRRIPAGSELQMSWLQKPPEVRPGDQVQVEVRKGPARLSLTALAQSAGARGDSVFLRNPQSGTRFTGRVAGPGLVVVE
jgi:flagella basal body P-ring formation protein FlgA